MRPRGKQWASGLSLALSCSRFFLISAAHGVNGAPSLNPAAILKNVASGGPLLGSGGGVAGAPVAAPRCPPPLPRNASHIPERSGLPSDIRGVGPFKSGLPSGNLGTPDVG